jgi:hypothetical protein
MKSAPISARLFTVGALLVSTFAIAGEGDKPAEVSRDEVVRATLAARAAGQLTPAGEAATPRDFQPSSRSSLTRSQVAAQVSEARQAHALIPAGEGVDQWVAGLGGGSTLTRADVKAGVIAARQSGELVPAGEGPDTVATTASGSRRDRGPIGGGESHLRAGVQR